MNNVQERERRLREAAKQVLEEWAKYKRSLPRFALEAIVDASEIKFPEIGAAMLGGGTTGVQLGAAAGLSIALLTYAGLTVFRKYRDKAESPYQYLNQIRKSVQRVDTSTVAKPTAELTAACDPQRADLRRRTSV